jgi:hypothetical protein
MLPHERGVALLSVLLVGLLFIIVITIWAGGTLTGAFKTQNTTLYSAACSDGSTISLNLTVQPYAAEGSDVMSYELKWDKSEIERVLYGQDIPNVYVQSFDEYPGAETRIFEKTLHANQPGDGTYAGGPLLINMLLSSTQARSGNQYISGYSQQDFNAIGDCLSTDLQEFNSALASLGSHLPGRDQSFYQPYRLGGLAYITPSTPDVNPSSFSCGVSVAPSTFAAGQPATVTWGSNNAAFASWGANEGGLVSLLGLPSGSLSLNGSTTLATRDLGGGQYELDLEVRSSNGSEQTCSAEFTVSKGVSITATIDQGSLYTTASQPVLSGTASANAVYVNVSVNHGDPISITPEQGRWTLTYYTLPPGKYPVSITDPSGNVIATGTLVVVSNR